MRLVCCLVPSVILFRNSRICSDVILSLAKFGKDCLVSCNRIFFVNLTCDNPARVLPFA